MCAANLSGMGKSDQLLKNEPVVMTVGGSDSGGGAGIQADLKTFAALGCFGTSALTCVTAQNPAAVAGVSALEPAFVAAQIRSICDAYTPAATKTGMMFSAAIVRAAAAEISAQGILNVVVDPVIYSASGARLLQDDALEAVTSELFPTARVITPNVPEAELLWGRSITTADDLRAAAREICARYDIACVAKGGHIGGPDDEVFDVLFDEGEEYVFKGKRIPDAHTHGAGCAFSAALAAFLGKGFHLSESVMRAKHFVSRALVHATAHGPHKPLKFNWAAVHGGEHPTT